MAKTEFLARELETLARVTDLSGRSKMNKEQLREALEAEVPAALDPFSDVENAEEGDWVSMNHLKSRLHITSIREEDRYTAVVMETKRGGRHKLVIPEGENEVGKNGSSPHLERWRAGDKEWMNNSTDPVYFFLEVPEADQESDSSDSQEDDTDDSEEDTPDSWDEVSTADESDSQEDDDD